MTKTLNLVHQSTKLIHQIIQSTNSITNPTTSMPQTFYAALQQRIKKGNLGHVEPDRYMIERAAKEVIEGMFGRTGMERIEVICSKPGVLQLKSAHSVWRAELKSNLGHIKKELNGIIKQNKPIKIFVSD